MKITYISHATLLIETDHLKIVTDPWVGGSSYCEQWHLFPKPLSPELIQDANFVVYSHGHEDHLHAESLSSINKAAQLFYPYSWYGGTKEFFAELGFKKVVEVMNEHSVSLAPGIQMTYLANNLDTVIVFEIHGKVILNINDALPSASEQLINLFISKIKKRWPKIDYLFSSYGGAAYFPNTVHFENKNDREIAETRELFFVTNFCKIVSALQPKFAIPFASDFVLLDDQQRWINECKFPRDQIKSFYKNHVKAGDQVEIIEAYPNDFFENGVFNKKSPYHEKKAIAPLLETIDEEYALEIEKKRKIEFLTPEALMLVHNQLKAHILQKHYIIPDEIKKQIKFAIKITDGIANNYLQVDFRNGNTVFKVCDSPDLDLDLLIQIKSKTILHSLHNEWGGDAIIIGYGAEIIIYKEEAVIYEYENYCVRLLSRYPNTKEYLKKSPIRALKYLISDDIKRRNLFNMLIHKQRNKLEFTDKKLGDRNLWLNKNKCEVCKACNI